MVGRLGPLGAVAGLAVAVSLRDPHIPGSWAVCPTYALLGVYCPGCGSLRALHDLVAGNPLEAFGHNALLIPALLFAAFAAWRAPGAQWGRAWLCAIAVFTLVRNIPGSPLAP